LSDLDAAKRINRDGIHILVDLMGFMEPPAYRILAHRPAPVQVNFLGYPGTMGTDVYDYIVADKHVLPFDEQPFVSERIVHLPDSYQPNDRKRPIAAETPSRAAAGLPETGFVFCCFNAPIKYTPVFFDAWMRLLAAVPGSVLWLMEPYVGGPAQRIAANLRREAAARGVDPARLVFAPRADLPAHLARHRLADLFLDTLPCNAHTTMSDALWAGLPAITCLGRNFTGRVGASLLHAMGLGELVTRSLEEYEALALALARDPARLGAIRARLHDDRLTEPLFDTPRFTAAIESAYAAMWQAWAAGKPPAAFAVDAGSR